MHDYRYLATYLNYFFPVGAKMTVAAHALSRRIQPMVLRLERISILKRLGLVEDLEGRASFRFWRSLLMEGHALVVGDVLLFDL